MATYNTAFGVLPSPNTQLFGGNAGEGEDGKAKQPKAQQQPTQPGGAAGTQTFAQMQAAGQARPAPPAMGAAPPTERPAQFQLGQAFQAGPQSQALLQQLSGRLSQMGEAPSVYEDPALVKRREAAMANLRAERQASEQQLQEEMARRGISSSSIASGRMGDVAGQFARAQGALEADLLKEAMAQEQQRQQFLTQQLGSLFGTLSQQELGGFQASAESARAKADIDARAEELQQQERLRGRELDLQQARDQATKEYQSGQLALGYAEMTSRERIASNELASRERLQQSEQTFQAGQSALERSLREKMQTTELSAAEKRQLADIEANKQRQLEQQKFQAEQNRIEQALREKMQTTELSAAEKRMLAEIEANKQRQAEQQKFQAEQSALERALRETLGVAELTGLYKGQQTIAGQQLTLQQQQAQNQLLLQLATTLAPMDEKKRNEFLRNNPQFAALLGQNRPAGSFGGGGGGGVNEQGIPGFII
jgi:hypothetical protein